MVEEIEVFVRPGNPSDPEKIKVTKPWVQAVKQEVVVWNVHRMSRDVEYVGIVFEDSDAKFFQDDKGNLKNYAIAMFHHNGDHAHILGVSPGLAKENPNSTMREDKYTIKGWKSQPSGPEQKEDGGYALDPVIVTCDP